MSETLIRKRRNGAARHSANGGAGRDARGASLGLSVEHNHDLIQAVQKGLLFNALESLARKSGIPATELSSILAIPERTFARRKSTGRFTPEESERLLRIARIFEQAVELFGGEIPEAVKWLQTPRKALGSHSPLEYSATELGAREVENLIGQLVHGVFP
jgi:putative toxin-antitoxin system antitoxin component (TIGR02293 family)